MKALWSVAVICCVLFFSGSVSAQDRGDRPEEKGARHDIVGTFFVINGPSTASRGPDSILTFDSHGNSSIFFGAENHVVGFRTVACSVTRPHHIFVQRNAFNVGAGFWIFNAVGETDAIVPSGVGGGGASFAFDDSGSLYSALRGIDNSVTIFRNDAALANLGNIGIGQLAVDGLGNAYLTDPFLSPRIYRIASSGTVSVFADASDGLESPYGLAVDSKNNVFVANNPGSKPGSILKIDPSGTSTSFATKISFQPIIRSLAFDRNHYLYATLQNDNTILKFDQNGNSGVFANESDGLNLPVSITFAHCPIPIPTP